MQTSISLVFSGALNSAYRPLVAWRIIIAKLCRWWDFIQDSVCHLHWNTVVQHEVILHIPAFTWQRYLGKFVLIKRTGIFSITFFSVYWLSNKSLLANSFNAPNQCNQNNMAIWTFPISLKKKTCADSRLKKKLNIVTAKKSFAYMHWCLIVISLSLISQRQFINTH